MLPPSSLAPRRSLRGDVLRHVTDEFHGNDFVHRRIPYSASVVLPAKPSSPATPAGYGIKTCSSYQLFQRLQPLRPTTSTTHGTRHPHPRPQDRHDEELITANLRPRQNVVDFTYIDDCVTGVAIAGIDAPQNRPHHQRNHQPRPTARADPSTTSSPSSKHRHRQIRQRHSTPPAPDRRSHPLRRRRLQRP